MAIFEATIPGANPIQETFTFPDLPIDQMWRIRILAVSVSSAPGSPGQATDLVMEFRPPGSTPASQRMRFFENAGPIDEAIADCERLVPRTNAGQNWILVVNGTKSDTMTVTVDWEKTIMPASAQ